MQLILGDCLDVLRTLPDNHVNCCVTSPPYFGLRDYGVAGQVGLEPTPDDYVAKLVAVFAEVRRVLRDDGTLWLNLGDSYARDGGTGSCGPNAAVGNTRKLIQSRNCKVPKCSGLKQKDLIGIPWAAAFALRTDGWYLRQDIIWHKPNAMPESVHDRCTKCHEYVFLLSKNKKYHYNSAAIKEPATTRPHAPGNKKLDASRNDHDQMQKVWGADGLKNKRSVWTVTTRPYKGAHFATFPEKLIEPCVLAGCPVGGIVLDPFAGSGTTLAVAQRLGRHSIGIELNPAYCELASARCSLREAG